MGHCISTEVYGNGTPVIPETTKHGNENQGQITQDSDNSTTLVLPVNDLNEKDNAEDSNKAKETGGQESNCNKDFSEKRASIDEICSADNNCVEENVDDWSIPRSKRKHWKKYLEQGYWNTLIENDIQSQLPKLMQKYDYNSIVRGLVSSFPDEHPKIFSIFVSSTFTDTEEERNLLIEDVQPYLREVCSLFGYEFRFCEMRWGVRDDASEDHQTARLCLQELQRCQEESRGINFITLLCDKYGFRPFPSEIPKKEFKELLSNIGNDDSRQIALKWFALDENMWDPHYVMKKISSVICDYNSNDRKKRTEARDQWWNEFQVMQKSLKDASSKLCAVERRKFYEISVTEFEVMNGLLEIASPNQSTFMVNRIIKNIEEHASAKVAGKFIDIDWPSKSVNMDSRQRLFALKNEKVPVVLDSSNIKSYELDWADNGISIESHMSYLQDVTNTICQVVMDSMMHTFLLENAITDRKESRLVHEIKQGAAVLKRLNESVIVREDITNQILDYCLGQVENKTLLLQPLILVGPSGSGKSTIMSTVITQIIDKSLANQNDQTIAFRFLGTTPDSGNTKNLLSSLIQQIRALDEGIHEDMELPDDVRMLASAFKQEVKKQDKHVVIFLDALDQLSDVDVITEVEWLPKELPQNVKLVVSCTPSKEGLSLYFNHLAKHVSSENLIHMNDLDLFIFETILCKWLETDRRKLAVEQRKLLQESFSHCPSPLFLKIAYGETQTWHSYTDTTNHPMREAESVQDLITQLYARLCVVHGKLLFERGTSYLTAAKEGLSRQELEDILSCDDDVLDDIFQWWVPPIRRIPQLQVVRLLSDLSGFFTESAGFSDGVPLIHWFHRQFKDTTEKMMQRPQNSVEIHRTLARYFSGYWAENGKRYFNKKDDKEVIADRKIPRNPLIIQGNAIRNIDEVEESKSLIIGNDFKINTRRLNEHCYHLIKGNLTHEAIDVLSSLDYIQCKAMKNQLEDLRQEYLLALASMKQSPEFKKLADFNSFVLQKGHILRRYPSLVYQEAANYKRESIVYDSYSVLPRKPAYILKTSVSSVEQSLRSVLEGHVDAVVSIALQRVEVDGSIHEALLASGSLDGKIKLWNTSSGLEKIHFNAHTKAVNHIDFVGDQLLSISADGRMILWDINGFVQRVSFEVKRENDLSDQGELLIPGNYCKFVKFNKKLFVSAWDDGIVRFGNFEGQWLLQTGKCSYAATCFVASENRLTVGYADGEVRFFDIFCDQMNSLLLEDANDGPSDINGCLSEIFDIIEHADIIVVIGKQKQIRTQYSEDSNSGWAKNAFKNDKLVNKWVEDGMEYTQAIQKKMDLDMASTGTFALTWNKDRTFFKHFLDGLPTPHEYVSGALYYPYLATGGSDGSIRIWDISQPTIREDSKINLLAELRSHTLEINQVCFSADGSVLASASDDADIRMWDITSLIKKDSIKEARMTTRYKITGCTTSLSGKIAITWGRRGMVSAWDLEEQKPLWHKICCSGEDINSSAISTDLGNVTVKVMVAGDNYYELLNGENGTTFDVKRSCVGRKVRICDFSLDGEVALLGDNCEIRLVVVEPEMNPLGFGDTMWEAHDDLVTCGQFISRTKCIVSGSRDGTVKFWNDKFSCVSILTIGSPVKLLDYCLNSQKIAIVVDAADSKSINALIKREAEFDQVEESGDVLFSKKEEEEKPMVIQEIGVPEQMKMDLSIMTDQESSKTEKPEEGFPVVQEGSAHATIHDSFSTNTNETLDGIPGNFVQSGPNSWLLPTASTETSAGAGAGAGAGDFSFGSKENPSILPPPLPNIGFGSEFQPPPMSEEMLKNLERLQEMFSNPFDLSEMGPPSLPLRTPGLHRLQKKEKRLIQYQETKRERKSAVLLFDIDIKEPHVQKVIEHNLLGAVSCGLSRDGSTLYASSLNGEVYVWKKLNEDWYDVARFVTEDEVHISDMGQNNDTMLLASGDIVQTVTLEKT